MTTLTLGMPTQRALPSRKRPLLLPIIAPKYDVLPSDPQLDISLAETTPVGRSRQRFPPRSRTGCWTCRSRKVKCDEGHPQCNQCSRLGHICDYRPRLSFRDDTRRVIERMAEVKTTGSIVWEPNTSTRNRSPPADTAAGDLLPPFSLLTSDEERERKAQTSSPGTYHVVVVPESFSHLPEYTENGPEEDHRDMVSSPLSSNSGIDQPGNGLEGESDPNVVIMKRFRDTKRYPPSNYRSPTLSPKSELRDSSLSAIAVDTISQDAADDDHMQDMFDQENQEAALLRHFRDMVWMQLIPTAPLFDSSIGGNLNPEIFEHEATNFLPLFHAMMAISALSLARQEGGQRMDAMQYYQQAFPSLQSSIRSNEDLLSDGLFLTHFLLLIYELAAAEPNGSNLWSRHISRLLHISLLRRSTLGAERYPFIIWWVCNIDLYALLSGAGTGGFVDTAIENHLLPGPESLLYPVGRNCFSLILPEEHDSLPVILRLYHDTFVLAARLGFFTAESRKTNVSFPYAHLDQQQREAGELREAFWRLWNSPEVHFLIQNQENLPKRSQDILHQSTLLYHTSLLFSHTSLWPGQRLGPGAAPEEQLQHHASAILKLTETIIAKSREIDRRFITFPIFLSGAVTSSSGLKMLALELLSNMEEEEIGYNAATTRYILEMVYERQMQQFQTVGHALNIDWVEVLAQHGLQLVNFG